MILRQDVTALSLFPLPFDDFWPRQWCRRTVTLSSKQQVSLSESDPAWRGLHSEWLRCSNKETLCAAAVHFWNSSWPFHSWRDSMKRYIQTHKLPQAARLCLVSDFVRKATKTENKNTPNIRYNVYLFHIFLHRGVKNHLVTTNSISDWIISCCWISQGKHPSFDLFSCAEMFVKKDQN